MIETKDPFIKKITKELMDTSIEQTLMLIKDYPKYSQVSKEHDEAEDKIKKLLGQENTGLFLEHDSLEGAISCIESEYIYMAGLRDGIALIKGLGLLG